MKHTKGHRRKKIPESPFVLKTPHGAVLHFSQETLYSIFLFVSLLTSGLLYTVSTSIKNTEVTFVTMSNRQALLEEKVRKLVDGFPIETMTPLIAEQNKTTAAFLVGIAKKESNWGKRIPRSEDGQDCYNYWGYRGEGSRGIAMGHGCFGSPEEAIGVVGGRLDTLIREYQFDTPEELIVWKCGWSCEGHSSISVKKWITDVGYYSHKVGGR